MDCIFVLQKEQRFVTLWHQYPEYCRWKIRTARSDECNRKSTLHYFDVKSTCNVFDGFSTLDVYPFLDFSFVSAFHVWYIVRLACLTKQR